MSRYFKQKKEHVLLKDLFLPLASFLLIVVLFFCGVQSVSKTAREEQLRSRCAARRCNATPLRAVIRPAWRISKKIMAS